MRSAYYPGVCTKPGTYYQGWFMYMRYTQGQNEEYVLSRSTHVLHVNQVCTYVLSKFHCRLLSKSSVSPVQTQVQIRSHGSKLDIELRQNFTNLATFELEKVGKIREVTGIDRSISTYG